MEAIKATMLSIRYRSPERNWLVAQMRQEGSKETFIATGDIPYSETEEPVQLYGEWIEDAKYGKQLKVSTSHRVLPSTVSGLRNYLAASEDIKGIGPVRATKLTEFFGTKLLDILDKNPAALSDCPGISNELAERIARSWKQDSAIRQLSMFLSKHGISPRWAGRILKYWDAGTAVLRITQNPYSLTAIEGIGFGTADEMAKALGIRAEDPRRIQAAVSYVLSEAIQKGSVFLHEGEVLEQVVRVIHPRAKSEETMTKGEEMAKAGLAKAIEDKDVIVEEITDGILTIKLIYLPYMYRAEKRLAERIAELDKNQHITPKSLDSAIRDVQQRENVSYSPKQVEAIRGAFSNNTFVITGGPGTGKTTCVKAICSVAERLESNAVLCAPTGRAAKRLSEVTGRTATTIHRLLQWRDDGPQRNGNNPIEAGLLIIDESSMLDMELAQRLFEAVPNGCPVVFIGDIDQLPAVGAGSTLRDIIRSKTVATVQLDTIFRQAESSLIVRNAHLIRRGEMPRFPETKGVKENSYVMWIPAAAKGTEGGRDDAEWLKSKLGRLVSTNIPEKFGSHINPIRDVQVLVPMKKHTMGTHELNKVLQQALNPNGEVYHIGSKTFRCGDRVMQTRNNYDEGMDVYNGDIGFIASNNTEEKQLVIDFYGRSVNYLYECVDDLQLAYAQTIHKSQGSEYPIVVVVMGYQHWPMLERNLLYTANTRAKDLCLFMASKGAIEQAVKNNPVKARNTYLSQRLRAYMAKEATLA
jgi:exodeoxyribonuclease V alpha subunit